MLSMNRLRPRLNAWHVLNQMQADFNKELADWLNTSTSANRTSLGVWTKAGEAVIALPLPGREPDDFDVSIHRNVVNISAKPQDEELPDGAKSVRQERVLDATDHRVQLPFEPDKNNVSAAYQRGLLVLRLSAAEASKPAKIAVHAG